MKRTILEGHPTAITVDDIAAKAGVSPSSVSRVLTGRGYASESTRRRVLEAAGELGYTPNRIAQSLRSKQTRTLGLIIADVENYFYSQIAKGVESVAKEAGYHVVLCNTNDDPSDERYYLDLLAGQRVDGLIITPTACNRGKLEDLIKRGMPIVQIDRRIEKLLGDAVLVDNAKGAFHAVKHLIQHGHKRIGLLAGGIDVTTGRQRLRGYEQALREHNLPVDASFIRAGSFLRDTAADAVHALLNTSPRPTAIFAANNILAETCMFTLSELGIRVPNDISVVAFDDPLWMRMIDCPLTTVAQPTPDMTRVAAEMLLRRISEKSRSDPVTIVLEPTLQLRKSVTPPNEEPFGKEGVKS